MSQRGSSEGPPATPGTWPAPADARPSEPLDAFPPRELAGYRLVRLLGQGGYGRVYLAEHTMLERPAAIKFMTRDDIKARERFLVEARAAARLQHPNVAQIYHVGEYRVGELESRPFLISEYVRGASLDTLPKPVTLDRALALGMEIARGLAALHQRGVLHRDIKPANIVVSQSGHYGRPDESGEVKLVDFGLAKLVDEATQAGDSAPSDESSRAGLAAPGTALSASVARVTESGELLGTRYYMAPEIWRGEPATPAADVYSLGVVLYELCTGHVPHHDVPRGELARVAQENDAPRLEQVLPGMDTRLAAIVNHCLAREPGARFASGTAVRDELEALRDRDRMAPTPPGSPYRGLRPFEAEHRAFFFGRDADIREIIDRLRAGVMVLLAGDSGVGKSSLARAGVVPRVAELSTGRDMAVCSMVPGRRPLAALARVLAMRMDMDEAVMAAALEHDIEAVRGQIRRHHGDSRGTLLLVDQLEETVTLAEPEQAAAFSQALARRLRTSARVGSSRNANSSGPTAPWRSCSRRGTGTRWLHATLSRPACARRAAGLSGTSPRAGLERSTRVDRCLEPSQTVRARE